MSAKVTDTQVADSNRVRSAAREKLRALLGEGERPLSNHTSARTHFAAALIPRVLVVCPIPPADGVLALPAAPGPAPLLRTPPAELDAFRQRLLELTCLAVRVDRAAVMAAGRRRFPSSTSVLSL